MRAGFFFGVRRSISKWAFDGDNLFDPGRRNVGQEKDLYGRSQRGPKSRRARLCLHTGTFVFHFKGSTIPYQKGNRDEREQWVMPATEPAGDAGGGNASERVL